MAKSKVPNNDAPKKRGRKPVKLQKAKMWLGRILLEKENHSIPLKRLAADSEFEYGVIRRAYKYIQMDAMLRCY